MHADAGTMGLVADLTAGEIVEQAVHASQEAPFKNVVFMGMVRSDTALFRNFSIASAHLVGNSQDLNWRCIGM